MELFTTNKHLFTQKDISKLISIAKQADKAILEIYQSDAFEVYTKQDSSLLTQADKASHDILTSSIQKLFPTTPIISEEGNPQQNSSILKSESFWLIDPLDGTKEFVNKNGEFTICIGFIHHKKPVFGMISVPTKNTVYYGGVGLGAWKKNGDREATSIRVAEETTNVVSVSRSHLSDKTRAFVDKNYPHATMIQAGSSLKATMLAEGLVDAYPVFDSRMSLWDLAASQAIIEAAGGRVFRPNGDNITYDAPDMLLGDFVATR